MWAESHPEVRRKCSVIVKKCAYFYFYVGSLSAVSPSDFTDTYTTVFAEYLI